MTGLPVVDIADEGLFGNEASELEQEAIFFSYAVNRSELAQFLDDSSLIQVACSYKGEGKSGLLRLVRRQLTAGADGPLLVSAAGSDIAPSLTSDDSDEWIRAWKQKILLQVCGELGTRARIAMTDDAISLVEEAELQGFKSRSIFSSIFDRLKQKHIEIEHQRLKIDNPERLLQRYAKGRSTIWIVVDDIDQNFENTPRYRLKVGTFFVACRQIVAAIPEIRFRVAVRPNIWSILKRQFEGLSHLRQYVRELSWSADEYRGLLAKRVESYLDRQGDWSKTKRFFPLDHTKREMQLIGLIFDDPMPWGGESRRRHPHVILHTLSRHRPRWLVELCKEAAKAAVALGHKKIGIDHITSVLARFGQHRIDDTIAEFQAQCPQVGELISAFSRQNERYVTDELIKTIRNRILGGVHPQLVGISNAPSEVEIAHFLFQIGFLTARRDLDGEHYQHLSYAEAPHLLSDRTSLDDGVTWEIHPVFRQTLRLQNVPT